MSARCSVDVVIPVYRPERDDRLLRSLRMLKTQTLAPESITLINTGREHFDRWAVRTDFFTTFPEVEVRHIKEREFDHAGTRNEGASRGHARFILFMTMDAVPADETLVERLARRLDGDPGMAAVYARQLPWPDAGIAERMAREFNYPERSAVKTRNDLSRLGIKALFMSNVCAMYLRTHFDRLGGFSAPAIFNEDMVFAGNALKAGLSVGYEAKAKVYHSHSYTAADQLHRNFDLGVSQAMHPEIFEGISSEGEGVKLVKLTLKEMLKGGAAPQIPGFLFACAARYSGYRLGRSYRKLPGGVVLGLTANRYFWNAAGQTDTEGTATCAE